MSSKIKQVRIPNIGKSITFFDGNNEVPAMVAGHSAGNKILLVAFKYGDPTYKSIPAVPHYNDVRGQEGAIYWKNA